MTRPGNFFIPLFLFILLLVGQTCICCAATPEPPAVPNGHVVDLAKIISSETSKDLTGLLLELEEKTGVQLVILTVAGLDGEDIETFSLRIAEKWKLGEKGKDNGLLFTIAVKDRRYRFEVGYGLEGVLPDSLVGSIGRKSLVPHFKKGNYSQGITEATGTLLTTLASSYGIQLTGAEKLLPGNVDGDDDTIATFVFFLFFIAFIFIQMRRSRRNSTSGRRSGTPPIFIPGGWSGGGGFGGGSGGFGGFSGGGGGFGGGGASGGW